MVANFWHNVTGKFIANGTRVEIRKLAKRFAPKCEWTYGNLTARCTDVIK